MPGGWTTWKVWQYSSAGTVPGIHDPGFTDLDRLQRGVTSLGP
jgi:GH25 family lysozyme M1 (1,4-beta-N-acetylmuramidase)